MKQTLKDNAAASRSRDRGQVVYVAPNKALVNQVSGDIYRRFGDVFGVLTSDWQYRVLSCDVLITVPASLEALLLDPQRADWLSGIRYVIFDEVHLIGSEEGLLWERCIQVCQHAPFLALSATVGNAEQFADWLQRCQSFHRRQLHLILHQQRWADLEKYAYVPQPDNPLMAQPAAAFQLSDLHAFPLVLRAQPQLASVCSVHPCAAVNNVSDLQEQQALPPELAFSPSDSLSLFDAMQALLSSLPAGSLPSELLSSLSRLEPDRYFTSLTITKSEAVEYERAIKQELAAWLRAGHAATVTRVVQSLSSELQRRLSSLHSLFPAADDAYTVAFQLRHLLPLLVELAAREQLPAIVFCHDQLLCNQLVIRVVEELERLQDERRREERTDESERLRQKEREKQLKAMRRLRDKQRNRAQEEELQREGTAGPAPLEEEEDDYDVDLRFSFLRQGEAMDAAEMEWWISRMLWKTGWKRSHPLVRCLFRGIGVHHGALVKPYRDAVETLFRAKHLKVVVATQTLALGINMPARSVVFCGDSKLLTPLQYRQMAGRAGRRGFDNVGHVVFFAVPPRKLFRLLKSPLLSLRGQYPVTASFTLRTLLFAQGLPPASQQLQFVLFPSLVLQSFFAHSEPSAALSAQLAFHFRYSCQLLLELGCLDGKGRHAGLAGFIAHLHAAEPANFILAALLLSGRLSEMTQRFGQDKSGVARELMQLLAHLVLRLPMPAFVAAAQREREARAAEAASAQQQHALSALSSSSVSAAPPSFLLEPLPVGLQRFVDAHNAGCLSWATRYLAAVAALVLDKEQNSAPPSAPPPAAAAPALPPSVPATAAAETAPAVAEERKTERGRGGAQNKAQRKGQKAAAAAAAAPRAASTESASPAPSPPPSHTVPAFQPPAPPASEPSLPPVFTDRFALPRSGLRWPSSLSPLSAQPNTVTGLLLQQQQDTGGGEGEPTEAAEGAALQLSLIRSPFVCLSGSTAAPFSSGRELCRSVRCGLYVDFASLPLLESRDRRDAPLPLNSFLLDFYRHGDMDLLIADNGIARSRVFELLKRFDLLLTQLCRSLTLLRLPANAPLMRAFTHLQQSYHELFARQALQH